MRNTWVIFLSCFFLTFFFKTVFLCLELTKQARLGSQWTLGLDLSLMPSNWITILQHNPQLFCCFKHGFWGIKLKFLHLQRQELYQLNCHKDLLCAFFISPITLRAMVAVFLTPWVSFDCPWTPCKWIQAVYALLHLASFAHSTVCEIYSLLCKLVTILSHGCLLFHRIHTPMPVQWILFKLF